VPPAEAGSEVFEGDRYRGLTPTADTNGALRARGCRQTGASVGARRDEDATVEKQGAVATRLTVFLGGRFPRADAHGEHKWRPAGLGMPKRGALFSGS